MEDYYSVSTEYTYEVERIAFLETVCKPWQ